MGCHVKNEHKASNFLLEKKPIKPLFPRVRDHRALGRWRLLIKTDLDPRSVDSTRGLDRERRARTFTDRAAAAVYNTVEKDDGEDDDDDPRALCLQRFAGNACSC
ncbi:hypothetical protein ElyMa_002865800 [Elysia marginata]|uniref:THAP-type domain-containing protein n=1 Tax=Elysia marginata TaxID=1093978 RepID=A0AAV4HY04_9GAST|nr:hypothetical protein ElyMa_002865800 [Elysia marginata]